MDPLLSNRSSGTVQYGPPFSKIGLLLYGTKDPPDVIVRDRLLSQSITIVLVVKSLINFIMLADIN